MQTSITRYVVIPQPGEVVVMTVGGEKAVSDVTYTVERYYEDSGIVYAIFVNDHTGEKMERAINSFIVNYRRIEPECAPNSNV